MGNYAKMSNISIIDCILLAERYDLPLDKTSVYIRSNMLNTETLTLTHKNLTISRTFEKDTGKVVDETVSVKFLDSKPSAERCEGC